MSDEQDRPRDAGEAIREGVRSITGMLGALREAIEETFDDLRGADVPAGERAGEPPDSPSAFRKAQETVEEVRERFDFVTRGEFEALRREVEELKAQRGDRGSSAAGSEPAAAPPPPASDPPPADPDDAPGGRYRFEVD